VKVSETRLICGLCWELNCIPGLSSAYPGHYSDRGVPAAGDTRMGIII